MIRTDTPARFSIRSELKWKPPWWLLFAWLAWTWTSLVLAGIIRGYEPPAGWVGAIAGTPLVMLLFGFVFWLPRKIYDQHLVVRQDGLLFAIPFRKLIPFVEIERVTRVNVAQASGEDRLLQGLTNFFSRRLVPTREEPPNIEIDLRRAVRLNLYPFRWFRHLVLTVDKPAAFLASLPEDITVYGNRGGEESPPKRQPHAFAEKVILVACLIVIAAGTIYWIGWDG